MKKTLYDFSSNIRKYVSYIMKVGFGELLINVGFLLLMIFISLIVYLPIGLLQDLIRSLFTIFGQLPTKVMLLYDWIFALVSAVIACFCFMYLFNEKICNGTLMKDASKDIPTKIKVKTGDVQEEFELPVEKKK